MAGYVWGYRVAMLVSGAGAIAAAGWLGWQRLVARGGGAAGARHPGDAGRRRAGRRPARRRSRRVWRRGRGRRCWSRCASSSAAPAPVAILAYVALFNLGEAMAGVMLAPFYRSLGFDRAAVAAATGVPALVCTMAGIAAGGWLVARIGLARALISTGLDPDGGDGDVCAGWPTRTATTRCCSPP